MGIFKQPGSPYWYYSFSIGGKRIRGTTNTASKTLAKEIFATKRADCVRKKHNIGISKQFSFEELKSEFLNWSKVNKKSYNRDVVLVGHLSAFFEGKDLGDITSLDVEKYMAERKDKVAPATVNREVACLKRMFNLAIRWEMADRNPVKGVNFFKEPKKSFNFWTVEDIEKFLNAATERMKRLVLVGVNTGMRISELLNLKWENVDFEHGYLTIEESKTGEYRKVKMNAVVIKTFTSMKRGGTFVFVNRDGQPYKLINRGFKSTCRRAGIKVATPHVMRHTFASHLTMLGVDLYTIMELGGWKSLEMVMRYSHLAPDHKQMAVNKLGEMFEIRLNGKISPEPNHNENKEMTPKTAEVS